jgi:hypothetical protein
MKDFTLILLSIIALTCLGASTGSDQTDAEHVATTSDKHGAIGDYVAAGLGMTTGETTSTLAVKTSGKLPEIVGSNSRFPTFSNRTARTTVTVPSGNVSIAADTVTNTYTTDCWHSWLDYWSASSANHGTDTITSIVLETVTHEFTKYWRSFVQTTTNSLPLTIYSDGYPVSITASYWTVTSSSVGWADKNVYDTTGSFPSAYLTTSPYILSSYEYLDISRPITVLPTPSCELPAVVPECSMQWSSYFRAQSNKNPFAAPSYTQVVKQNSTSWTLAGTPDCTQAKITGDWCSSLISFYLSPQTIYGELRDPGWETASGTSYFPASRSLAPGCSLGCQACSITGDSVQLLYWPPTTAAIVKNSTETATLTPFAQNSSSIRTAIIDGEYVSGYSLLQRETFTDYI